MSEKSLSELRAERDDLLTRLGYLNIHEPANPEGSRIMQDLKVIESNIWTMERRAERSEIAQTLGFHWKDGWYFQRLEDGSVRVTLCEDVLPASPEEIMTIDANSWASIIASVSGDYGPGRWDEARQFHRIADASRAALEQGGQP